MVQTAAALRAVCAHRETTESESEFVDLTPPHVKIASVPLGSSYKHLSCIHNILVKKGTALPKSVRDIIIIELNARNCLFCVRAEKDFQVG